MLLFIGLLSKLCSSCRSCSLLDPELLRETREVAAAILCDDHEVLDADAAYLWVVYAGSM